MKIFSSKYKVALPAFLVALAFSVTAAAQAAPDQALIDKSSPAVAIVLVGDGEGVVTKIAPAVVIKSDGVLLVPFHVISGAKEVQVRLKNGEIFDEVMLLGTDERRDIAAIKIRTTELPATTIAGLTELKTGDPLLLFTHFPGKTFFASNATLTGIKLADDVPGAGEGYRVIQFDGTLDDGIDGGIIFDARGNPAAIVTREVSGSQKSGFAVPIENVRALADADRSSTYRSGSALKLPKTEAIFRANKLPDSPLSLLQRSKTIYVDTNTTFFKEAQLINELNKRPIIKDWGWVLTTGSYEARNRADIIIELDHQIMTFNFTFTVRHRKTSILISAGKVIIADGASGAPQMADRIVKSISEILNPPAPKTK